MANSGVDISGFHTAYDKMIHYVNMPDAFLKTWEELQARNVKSMNFFDVVLDFIFLDAFDDLANPPGSVLSIIKNRWLSLSFKKSALQTAVFYVLKSKRNGLANQEGFMARFYDISEHVTPFLAWGFLGTDQELNEITNYFHDHLLGFIRDIFSFHRVRYMTIEEMKTDILRVAQRRVGKVLALLEVKATEVPFKSLDSPDLFGKNFTDVHLVTSAP